MPNITRLATAGMEGVSCRGLLVPKWLAQLASCYICTKTCTKGLGMDAMTYSTARANLAGVMNRVCEDHEPLIITRNGEQSVVMLSLDDYKALEETAHLLRTPANARRLLASIAQLNSGEGMKRELIE